MMIGDELLPGETRVVGDEGAQRSDARVGEGALAREAVQGLLAPCGPRQRSPMRLASRAQPAGAVAPGRSAGRKRGSSSGADRGLAPAAPPPRRCWTRTRPAHRSGGRGGATPTPGRPARPPEEALAPFPFPPPRGGRGFPRPSLPPPRRPARHAASGRPPRDYPLPRREKLRDAANAPSTFTG